MDSRIAPELRIREYQPGDNEGPEVLTLTIPSDLKKIEETVELVSARCIDMGLKAHVAEFNVRIALTEALANAIMYGNGMDSRKSVSIEARASAGRISIRVADEGTGFDPRNVPDPTAPERIRLTDGRGIFLIRRLVDDVSFSERGNAICMVLRQS